MKYTPVWANSGYVRPSLNRLSHGEHFDLSSVKFQPNVAQVITKLTGKSAIENANECALCKYRRGAHRDKQLPVLPVASAPVRCR